MQLFQLVTNSSFTHLGARRNHHPVAAYDPQTRPLLASSIFLILIAACSALPVFAEYSADEVVTINPKEENLSLPANPGRGWETNNKVVSEYAAGVAPSSIAYFKYYLKTFLRDNGTIDLTTLSQDIARARDAGQQFAFRLMIFSEEEGGEILRAFGIKRGMKYRYDDGDFRGAELWAPDFEDESTLAVLQKLLSEIGKQFDGDPSLHHIDIGYVGLWGEWHTSDTRPKIAMPSAEVQRRIIDMHFDAFPKTPKLMQLQGVPGLRYALQKGAGLRADCLADPSTFMMKLYPLTLLAAGAVDSWKESPVVFEICWKLEDWSKKGWNSEAIFTTALERYHASLINTKSADIPADIRPAFDRMLERIGYRFTIKELRHQKTVLSTAPLNLTLIIENSGVAPCYGDFRVAIRLRPKDGSGPEIMLPTEARLCKQVPGRFRLNAISTTAHANIPSGKYDLGIGIVRGESSTPIVKLNNAGEKDGWYWLSSLHIY